MRCFMSGMCLPPKQVVPVPFVVLVQALDRAPALEFTLPAVDVGPIAREAHAHLVDFLRGQVAANDHEAVGVEDVL